MSEASSPPLPSTPRPRAYAVGLGAEGVVGKRPATPGPACLEKKRGCLRLTYGVAPLTANDKRPGLRQALWGDHVIYRTNWGDR